MSEKASKTIKTITKICLGFFIAYALATNPTKANYADAIVDHYLKDNLFNRTGTKKAAKLLAANYVEENLVFKNYYIFSYVEFNGVFVGYGGLDKVILLKNRLTVDWIATLF